MMDNLGGGSCTWTLEQKVVVARFLRRRNEWCEKGKYEFFRKLFRDSRENGRQ
jgi:hypothetical protein